MNEDEAESKKITSRRLRPPGCKFLPERSAAESEDRQNPRPKNRHVAFARQDSDQDFRELVFHQSALVDLRHRIAALKTSAPKIDIVASKR